MSSITELLYSRRSCRKYTTEPVAEEDIKELQRAALSAPTSKNGRSWHFYFVENKETIKALSKSKEKGATFLAEAPLAIVIMGSPLITDVWIEDTSIAATQILLQAQALGLGACWIQMRRRGFEDGTKAATVIRSILNAPEDLDPLCIISVGHPDESHRPYTDDRLPWDKIHKM